MGWQLCKVTRAKTQATLPHRLSCRREQAEQKTEEAARGSSCSRTRRLGIGLLACDVTKSSGREQEAGGACRSAAAMPVLWGLGKEREPLTPQ